MKLLFRETAPTMTWHFSEKVFLHPLIKSLSLLCQGAQREKLNDNDLKSSKSKREKKSSKKSLVKVKEMSNQRQAL